MAYASLSIDLKAQLAGLQSGMDKAVRLAEKDAARKAFRVQQVAAISQALVNTALAVSEALASAPPPSLASQRQSPAPDAPQTASSRPSWSAHPLAGFQCLACAYCP